jgi:hypothetical protein
MDANLPAACQVALKEWASVVEAFARGEQLVLIRKGGLAEAKSGFQVVASPFLFYPTFEHQTIAFLRDSYRRDVEVSLARRPSPNELCLELCWVVASSAHVQDPALIERLEPFHIYNDSFLKQRLKWQPDQPLVVAVVRAFRLASPRSISVSPRYAGCKSWVELDEPIAVDGAQPVLDDQTFQERLQQIHTLLA